eukprot:6205241-Pleurochrysis_carterae.AAC.2
MADCASHFIERVAAIEIPAITYERVCPVLCHGSLRYNAHTTFMLAARSVVSTGKEEPLWARQMGIPAMGKRCQAERETHDIFSTGIFLLSSCDMRQSLAADAEADEASAREDGELIDAEESTRMPAA